MALINSAIENKNWYSKDEALIRMIALGITMMRYNGTQYYCYRDGVFYVSPSIDLREAREWDTNNSSLVAEWVNV